MVAGKTPPFCNLYEFNTGGEKGNYRPDAYYFPFSLIYAFSAMAGGRALGWNVTGFISLWFTFFLTWLLVRRYTQETWPAACAAVIVIILPFRWFNLCGGSPAGFACAWIPAIFLGIDLAARDGRIGGGMLAGLALLLASWTDNHVYFFGALAAPGWALIALLAGLDPAAKKGAFWWKRFVALLPIPLFLGLALSFPRLMQMLAGTAAGGKHLAATVASRSWQEVALYSPKASGFFGWVSQGVSDHIYIGFAVFVILTVGALCLLLRTMLSWRDNWRRLLLMILIVAGIAGIMALALGVHGPDHAVLLRACRKLIPPYALIRQPAKIYCLLPALLAVGAGLGLSAIGVCFRNRRAGIYVVLLLCGAAAAEYSLRVRPTISLLDSKQGAYAAVADDAAFNRKASHALVVPLWPGDSHYSSVYQYYASLYRVRMINGYNPFVSKSYVDDVFRRYESVNQGLLTDIQADELLRCGIEYVLLHEDLFPEKVSPFPIGWTLKQFLANKRLKLLKQNGRVWAFKLLAGPVEKAASGTADWITFGCARNWQAENSAAGRTQIIRNSFPFRTSYAVLQDYGNKITIPPQRVAPAPCLRWMVRARGYGAVTVETTVAGIPTGRESVVIRGNDWRWLEFEVEGLEEFAPIGLNIELAGGRVECDQIQLAAGESFSVLPGRTIELPAPCFFHAGYTDTTDDTVVLEKGRDQVALIFYGLKLPLEKGKYRMELLFNSRTPDGTLLGQFNLKRYHADDIINWIPVVNKARSLTEFTQPENTPMHMEFRFLGNGSLKISGIKLTRLE